MLDHNLHISVTLLISHTYALLFCRYQNSSPDDEFSEDLKEDMCYYEVMHTNVGGLSMLVRYKVDALDGRGEAVEFKSRKQPNPRYPLGIIMKTQSNRENLKF